MICVVAIGLCGSSYPQMPEIASTSRLRLDVGGAIMMNGKMGGEVT